MNACENMSTYSNLGKRGSGGKKGERACDHFFYDPFPSILATSGFGCQTVKILIRLNHSHISRASISHYLNSTNLRSFVYANYGSEMASVNLVIHCSKKTKLTVSKLSLSNYCILQVVQ